MPTHTDDPREAPDLSPKPPTDSVASGRLPVLITTFVLIAAAALSVWFRLEPARFTSAALARFHGTEELGTFPYSKDAYAYLRQSAHVLETGRAFPENANGESWDPLSLAPRGRRSVRATLLPYLQAAAAGVTGGHDALMRTMFWLPILWGLLGVVGMWAAGRHLGGDLAGAVAALGFAIHPEIVVNSHAGVGDTTPLILLLLVGVLWSSLAAIDRTDQRERWWGPGLGLGMVLAIFSVSWEGWIFPFVVVAGFGGLLLAHRSWRRGHPILTLVAAASATAITAVTVIATGVFDKLRLYMGSTESGVFPSALPDTLELQSFNATQLAASLGGWAVLAIALVATVLAWGTKARIQTLFLLTWIVPAAVLAASNLRFAMLAVPALVLLVAYGISEMSLAVSSRGAPRLGVVTAIAALAIWAAWTPVHALRSRVPGADLAVWEVSREIAETTPPETVLHAWWDMGYLFSALAERGVIVDGGTNSDPRIYWFSRALATTSPELAARTLRLMACGQDEEAYRRVARATNRSAAISIMNALLATGHGASRRAILDAERVTGAEADAILGMLSCEPEASLLVLTSDLFLKTTSWVRYADWEPEGDNPPIAPLSSVPSLCHQELDSIVCRNGNRLQVRLVPHQRRGTSEAPALVLAPDGQGFRSIYVRRGAIWEHVAIHDRLLDSLFVRLFVLGEEVDGFAPVTERFYPPYTRRVGVYAVEAPGL